MPALSPLPKCILSAVVTVSVYRLIGNGVKEFRFLYYVSKIELFEFCVALIAPLIVGLEIGIFVAIGASIFVNFILRNSSVFVKIHKLMKVDSGYIDENFQKFIDIQNDEQIAAPHDGSVHHDQGRDGLLGPQEEIDGYPNNNANKGGGLLGRHGSEAYYSSKKRPYKMSYNDQDLMDGMSSRHKQSAFDYGISGGSGGGLFGYRNEMVMSDIHQSQHSKFVDGDEKKEQHERDELDGIMIIELNAQLSYINSKRMIDLLETIISDKEYSGIHYIIISLAMTAFIDTTTIRQICALFQDLLVNDKWIGFSNCGLSVINSVKKYEAKTKCSFNDNNIKLFVSTNDAVKYFKAKIYSRV